MRILHFDCFSGAAGDMVVGALRDAGVGEEVFLTALQQLGLSEPISVHFERGIRQGIAGWFFRVEAPESPAHPHHPQEHAHHGHPHGRSYAEIRRMLEASEFSGEVKARALSVFRRIAVAEARIHGLEPDAVHFHEIGALDSIADIVCACAGLAALGAEKITAGPLVEGSGFIECAHGRFPLPAPATLEILRGLPIAQDDQPGERFTPTGAAILAEFSESFGPMPNLRPLQIGFGLGTRDVPGRPNVLRIIVGEGEEGAGREEVMLLETNLDDLSPELAAAAMEALQKAGALDVWTTPAQMKKNRPGFVLAALAPVHLADSLAEIILRETTAFGVRMRACERRVLAREIVTVTTPFGPVLVKVGSWAGQRVQASPEFSSCAEVAERAGVTVREVFLAALAAVASRQPTP